jgi:hypothetical protein
MRFSIHGHRTMAADPGFGEYPLPANGETLIARGEGSVIQERSTQHRLLCQQLVARNKFRGFEIKSERDTVAAFRAKRWPPSASSMQH